MKISTGAGDTGKTSLFSGERVSKDHVRIEAYGDVDELNAILGALVASLPADYPELAAEIQQVQSDLFHVGAWLATTPDSPSIEMLEPFAEERTQRLEQAIDRMEEELPPLTAFLLPGGHMSAAWAHVARTVCRRAERHTVRLAREREDPNNSLQQIIVYLNRLSDYLFVLARHCNRIAGIADQVWQK
jgi:cob(I)alamin adenosyltransferase